jgi:hypothetical protein
MRTLGIVLAVLLVIAAGATHFYLSAFPSETVRYRLTLEAQVDGRPAVGSGVIEVTRQDTTRVFGSMGGVGAIVKGEAIVLDLAQRGSLFALIHANRARVEEDAAFPSFVIFHAFPGDTLGSNGLEFMRALRTTRPRAELPPHLIPMLVRFRDISDPKTVELVHPYNLSATFGPGVVFRRAAIEITDDPVTTRIDTVLPWLAGLGGRYLTGEQSSAGELLGLHTGHFKRR